MFNNLVQEELSKSLWDYVGVFFESMRIGPVNGLSVECISMVIFLFYLVYKSVFMYPPFFLVSVVQTTQYVYSIERSISRNKTCAHPVCFCCLLDIYLKHLSIKP